MGSVYGYFVSYLPLSMRDTDESHVWLFKIHFLYAFLLPFHINY